MGFGIGIDTGGTYTDAVIYDFGTRTVLAKGKARTTKEDLSVGICAALDLLPLDLARKADIVALSTTLATNACVEGKGGRAKAVLVGTNEGILKRIDATARYGFSVDDALCIDVSGSFDGSTVVMPDWDEFIADHEVELAEAQAFGIAEVYAERNGAVVEQAGASALEARFGVPIVKASTLANGLNMMERGATAILNARLLPVIEEFLDAAAAALAKRGIDAPIMIVRSDASLMGEAFAREAPVETMVSGPAASVQGCCKLVDEPDAVIVDMGGTTSDISIVEHGKPATTERIRIGNWRTQVQGVLIDTIGLGGDSAIDVSQGIPALSEARVEPLCAAMARWPFLLERLEALVESPVRILRPLHEVLYLVREPDPHASYTAKEQQLIELLRQGPKLIGDITEFENFELERTRVPARLESEGIVMRCGLTPTDIMHIRGDFARYDARASWLAARYLCATMRMYGDTDEGIGAFCDDVYDLVKSKLYVNIIRVLLAYRFPKQFSDGLPKQLEAAFAEEWKAFAHHGGPALPEDDGLRMGFSLQSPLIGVGAPIHIFLPDVAAAIGAPCVIPQDAEVANAIGAAVASVTARVVVRITADWSAGGLDGYVVNADGFREEYVTKEEAESVARGIASEAAEDLARRRGASGPMTVSVTVEDQNGFAEGARLYLGSTVTATASMM